MNMINVSFNLRQICRELKSRHIQFSTNGSMISILFDVNIIRNTIYIDQYDHEGSLTCTYEIVNNPMLKDMLITAIKYKKDIRKHVAKNITSAYDIQIILTKYNITITQYGKIIYFRK